MRLMCSTDMQGCDQCYNTRRSKLSIVNTSPVEYAVRRESSRTVATFRQLVYIVQMTVSAYASSFVGSEFAIRRAINFATSYAMIYMRRRRLIGADPARDMLYHCNIYDRSVCIWFWYEIITTKIVST